MWSYDVMVKRQQVCTPPPTAPPLPSVLPPASRSSRCSWVSITRQQQLQPWREITCVAVRFTRARERKKPKPDAFQIEQTPNWRWRRPSLSPVFELSWLSLSAVVSGEIILQPDGPASSPSESKHLPCLTVAQQHSAPIAVAVL